jgi:hypothetical protein
MTISDLASRLLRIVRILGVTCWGGAFTAEAEPCHRYTLGFIEPVEIQSITLELGASGQPCVGGAFVGL